MVQHSDDGLLVDSGLGRARWALHFLTEYGVGDDCRAGCTAGGA